MKNNINFVYGAIMATAVMMTLSTVYGRGKTKGYTEGLKYQKERLDIYNHGYADGCKINSKAAE